MANAKIAYQLFLKKFSGARWDALSAKGARVQRPLWASVGTKNPAYSDVKYVDELIGPRTVSTMPPRTIDAFRDHGIVARTVDADVETAHAVLADLQQVGISMREVTDLLLREGLAKFAIQFPKLDRSHGASEST